MKVVFRKIKTPDCFSWRRGLADGGALQRLADGEGGGCAQRWQVAFISPIQDQFY